MGHVNNTRSLSEVLGSRIREIRQGRGLSQAAVAAASKIHNSDLCRIEKGKGPRSLGIERIRAITVALGVELAELFRTSSLRRHRSSDRRSAKGEP